MVPNFSRKVEPRSGKKQEKEKTQHESCSRPFSPSDEVICCGVKIKFFEDCGHTMTIADHHKSCTHFDPEAAFPYDRRYGRLLTGRPPPPPPPKPMTPKAGSKLPFPQPQCKDLHRYINLVSGTCGCLFPERHDSLPATGLTPERSERAKLTSETIRKRRVYWLHQKSLDDQTSASIKLAEWSARLRKRQQQEEQMSIPIVDRTFVYDPDQGANIFLGAIEIAFLTKTQKTCVVCKKGASNRNSRKLPCGCVFDVECLKGWFLGRKDCPLCRKKYRLVKKLTAYEAGHGKPVWEGG